MPRTYVAPFLAALLLAGCAGSSTGLNLNNPLAQYAGTYRGTADLEGTQSGAFTVIVAPTGSATGTFIVTDSAATRVGFDFGVGTYNLSGQVQPNGSFTMVGTTPNGDFTVDGTIPLGSGTGTVSVTAGGVTYPATYTVDIDPTPTPTVLTFSDNAGSNVSGTFPNGPYVITSTVGQQIAFGVTPSAGDSSKALSGYTNIPVGTTTPVGGINGLSATILYSEGQKEWSSQGTGTVTLVSASGPYELRLNAVEFIPDVSTGASGTFKISGTVKK